MKVIIIGGGKVGYSVAEKLSMHSGNDVTIVERKAAAISRILDRLDVKCIEGNGVRTGILVDAGVRESDLLVAATSEDEMNMVCCLIAKKLGAKHAIARIRDPEYAYELDEIKLDLGIDMVINPEQSVAEEIANLLEYPGFLSVEPFAKGLAQLCSITVAPEMPIARAKLNAIGKYTLGSVLVCVIARGSDATIPSGESEILPGDVLYLIGKPADLLRFATSIGVHKRKVRNAMIVGGGRIGYYLAKSLSERGIQVKIIEASRERCAQLAELLPDALIINADGSDDRVLSSENLEEMDGFVAVTGMDEENLMTALVAKKRGVEKAIAKVNRSSYLEILSDSRIDHIVDPKAVTANCILRAVRGIKNAQGLSAISTLYEIAGNRAEAIEFTAMDGSPAVGVPFRSLKMKEGILCGIIIRKGQITIPSGGDSIQGRDSVVIVTKGHELNCLEDILAGAR
jgi:trk system potassium uptake protein TrkA